ncbi:hypothetical protein B0H15DRAFT_1010558 [Mycena belliarum]|uniref:Uncharacterized protein n=1 Tax=Mycena belliarum TaxID=1033014 RepID=A0AAD6TUI6_9AGAR|nr:hypothetical protein B0H15DRAFT_1010558 [Mycena belliae]
MSPGLIPRSMLLSWLATSLDANPCAAARIRSAAILFTGSLRASASGCVARALRCAEQLASSLRAGASVFLNMRARAPAPEQRKVLKISSPLPSLLVSSPRETLRPSCCATQEVPGRWFERKAMRVLSPAACLCKNLRPLPQDPNEDFVSPRRLFAAQATPRAPALFNYTNLFPLDLPLSRAAPHTTMFPSRCAPPSPGASTAPFFSLHAPQSRRCLQPRFRPRLPPTRVYAGPAISLSAIQTCAMPPAIPRTDAS